MATPSLLIARGITKRYGRKVVLQDVGLAVSSGEVVGLVGENGAGKTTLLRICAGLLTPDAGEILVEGRIGYCPQTPGVLDLLTADEHLVYFGAALGLARGPALAAGHRLLAAFDFPWEDQQEVVKQFSGGTRQKLNLALALLGDPAVLLLDEPYQGFDRGVYVNFWEHVRTWRDQGKAIVVVTHLLAEGALVDRVIELPVHQRRWRGEGQR